MKESAGELEEEVQNGLVDIDGEDEQKMRLASAKMASVRAGNGKPQAKLIIDYCQGGHSGARPAGEGRGTAWHLGSLALAPTCARIELTQESHLVSEVGVGLELGEPTSFGVGRPTPFEASVSAY
eukprot:gene22714-29875_t